MPKVHSVGFEVCKKQEMTKYRCLQCEEKEKGFDGVKCKCQDFWGMCMREPEMHNNMSIIKLKQSIA